MTTEEERYNLLPDLDPEKLRMYRLARLAGKHKDDFHLGMLGLKDIVPLVKQYAKAQKLVAEAGRAAGLDVDDRAVISGRDDPRAERWEQAIAIVYPPGTPDNARMRAYTGLPQTTTAVPADVLTAGPVREHGSSGVSVGIGLAPAAERINAAVASLGDRQGDRAGDIASDLRTALHDRFLDLPQEHLDQISQELAKGEEVIVQIVKDDQAAGFREL